MQQRVMKRSATLADVTGHLERLKPSTLQFADLGTLQRFRAMAFDWEMFVAAELGLSSASDTVFGIAPAE